jgi:hypothetical protein
VKGRLRRTAQRLLLIGVGSALGLVLAELLARAVLPAPLPQKLPLIRLEADAHCGYKHRPSQSGYSLSGRVTINRWGFRGPDWPVAKAPGVIRIALLGDSYVYGPGVSDEETFAVRLEDTLNADAPPGRRYEVLNFGVSGYDTGHELKLLEHHALRFQPDLVLLHFFLNDLVYVKDYSFYPELFAAVQRDFSLRAFWTRELARRSYLAMHLWDELRIAEGSDNPMRRIERAYTSEQVLPPSGPGAEGWQFVERGLERFAELAATARFKPYLVIVPLAQEIVEPDCRATYGPYLAERAHAVGVETVDLVADLQQREAQPAKLFLPYDWHFSPEGHQCVADTLARRVDRLYRSATVRRASPPANW